MTKINSWVSNALCSVAVTGLIVGGAGIAFAQSHTSGGSHEGGKATSGSHEDSHADSGSHTDSGKGKGSGRKGGDNAGHRGGNGGQDLRDVFKTMEEEAAEDSKKGSSTKGQGSAGSGKSARPTSASEGRPADKGGAKAGASGNSGNAKGPSETEEDSDRPDYAGPGGRDNKPGRPSQESGTKKGDIYGDMYVILRDENGVPILDNGYVQVKYLDENGTLQCCVLRDAEGNLLPTLADGTPVSPIEVELGRLSVGRAPTNVLAAQYEEAISTINSAASVSLDTSGRIVVTLADGTQKTIDSPLENLALYYELIATGTLGGVDATKLGDLSYLADGTLNAQDLAVSASLFAAASDKTIPVSVDSIEYMNSILGIEGSNDGYVDYSAFTYDREAVYGSVTTTVLQQESEGVWKEVTINVYDAVFNSKSTGELTNVSAFTTAADDARTVINYLHEYSLPTAE